MLDKMLPTLEVCAHSIHHSWVNRIGLGSSDLSTNSNLDRSGGEVTNQYRRKLWKTM
jgi:hypothetical protein